MNCEKCNRQGIDAEAHNAPGGGFLCKACYRKLQCKSVAIGLALVIVGLVAVAVFLVVMVVKNWPPGN